MAPTSPQKASDSGYLSFAFKKPLNRGFPTGII